LISDGVELRERNEWTSISGCENTNNEECVKCRSAALGKWGASNEAIGQITFNVFRRRRPTTANKNKEATTTAAARNKNNNEKEEEQRQTGREKKAKTLSN